MELEQQVAIVTGAASGIGRSIALTFAAEGASIHIADIDEQGAQETVRLIEAEGGRAAAARCDVSVARDVQAALEQAQARFGTLDTLVNDAGVTTGMPFLEFTEELFDRILAVNLRGPFLFSQAFARALIAQGKGGRIVNIVSTAAEAARINAVGYCASKAGLAHLTRAMALELGPYGITVNAVGPGMTMTQRIQQNETISTAYQRAFLKEVALGRPGQPQDIAKAVLFLASRHSAYMTGQVLYVDGGYTAGKLSVQG